MVKPFSNGWMYGYNMEQSECSFNICLNCFVKYILHCGGYDYAVWTVCAPYKLLEKTMWYNKIEKWKKKKIGFHIESVAGSIDFKLNHMNTENAYGQTDVMLNNDFAEERECRLLSVVRYLFVYCLVSTGWFNSVSTGTTRSNAWPKWEWHVFHSITLYFMPMHWAKPADPIFPPNCYCPMLKNWFVFLLFSLLIPHRNR